jgi:hypothetical protein
VHWAPGIPRALCFQGGDFMHNSDASRREIVELYLDVIARSESDEAINLLRAAKWIASRSLSSGAPSRDPLARNDEW